MVGCLSCWFVPDSAAFNRKGAAMHKLLVVLALAGLMAGAVTADDTKTGKANDPAKKARPAVTLKVGDAAPMLKATRWLQGQEVKSFESGKVYVVEFWATWCGPCIVMMPHLGELQSHYRDKGVTVIGYTPKGRNNDEDKVVAFVKKRGPKLGYTFAYADNMSTYDAWMKAAGRDGIPCAFVVDGAGKIAYIGHPMYLDVVLPKVVNGTWKGQQSKEVLDGIQKEVGNVFRAVRGQDPNPKASLKVIEDFETKHPALAKIPYFVGGKLNLLLQVGKEAEARKMAEAVMAAAIKQDDPTALQTVSGVMRSGKAKGNKELLGLSLKAANAMLEVAGDRDTSALLNLAEVYLEKGERAKAVEYGKKAIAAADNPRLKEYLEKRVKAFEDSKDADKK
jgi:thiol-disulfide isomerase/thioredoxin